ncbi:hypothetical protein FHT44_005190 [Mycolicibacterium sp. BK634]|uniref:hypothetical protein n=1 Tax=Mycolicibacterium sp. BK634 TaxID=2587099 RepID=UPI001612F4B6|nr:hypothetical protein [Mycolicibacterium sp. BK634]MBB3752678.1 hypothetical protein [Mycolicibacterium sp. BK634]
MNAIRKIKLYSQDWSEAVFETECPFGQRPQDAEDYLRASGSDWLGLVMEYGPDWRQRWSGRLELKSDGSVEAHRWDEYLKHITVWPNPAFESHAQLG